MRPGGDVVRGRFAKIGWPLGGSTDFLESFATYTANGAPRMAHGPGFRHCPGGTLSDVSPLAIRRLTRRLGRNTAGLLVGLAVSGAIVAHYGAMSADGMPGHHDVSAAVEMCLGMFTAVGAAVVAVAIGILALGRWPSIELLPPGAVAVGIGCAEARAGPGPLSLLCVWRR